MENEIKIRLSRPSKTKSQKIRQDTFEIECDTCGKTFRTKTGMLLHLRSEPHEKKSCVCEKCGKPMPKRTSRALYPGQCRKCSKQTFKNTRITRTEIRQDTSEIECDTCGKTFRTKNGMILHLRSEPHEKKSCVCEKCGKPMPKRNSRALYPGQCRKCSKQTFKKTRITRTEKPREKESCVCKKCGKPMLKKTSRAKYPGHCIKCSRNTEIKSCVCEKCGKPMPKRTSRAKYPGQCRKCSRNTEITRTEICDICGRLFSSRYVLEEHQRVVHDNIKQFICDICGKLFARESYLNHHKFVHSSEKPYKCIICDRGFAKKYERSRHETRHEKDNLYFCAHCHKQFRSKEFLYYHVRAHLIQQNQSETAYKFMACKKSSEDISNYKGVLRFSCAHCNEQYDEKTLLVHHIQNEHTEAPLIDLSNSNLPLIPRKLAASTILCDMCDKQFSTKDATNRHKQTVHGAKKPYKCGQCDRWFSRKDQVTRHAAVHSLVKPFKCSICELPFKSLRNQRQHEEGVHGQVKYCCSLCGAKISRKYHFTRHMQNKHPSVLIESSGSAKRDNYLIRIDNFDENVPEKHSSSLNESLKGVNNYNHSTNSSKSEIPVVQPQSSDVAGDSIEQDEFSDHFLTEPSKSTVHSHQSAFVSFVYDSAQQQISNFQDHFIDESSKSTIQESQPNSSDVFNDSLEHLESLSESFESTITEIEEISPACTYNLFMETDVSESSKSKITTFQEQFPTFINDSSKQDGTSNHSVPKRRISKTPKIQTLSSTLSYNPFKQPEVESKFQPFSCDICGRRYTSKCNLNRHNRTVHITDAEKPFACSTCGKLFALNCELTKHAKVHSSDRPFKCSVCQKGFLTKGHRKDHEIAMHGAIGRYWCAHCDEKFVRREKLIFHLQTVHFPESEKSFVCNVCNKSFAFKRLLKDHAAVHESKKPYECPKCNLSFKRFKSRKRHMLMVHEAKLRYDCAYCNKTYRYKDTLSRHISIHHSYPVET